MSGFEANEAIGFVREVFGWGRDAEMVIRAAQGFRHGWIMNGSDRKAKRALALHVISDTVEALDRLCAVGSITFHIHGERCPGSFLATPTTMAPNVTFVISNSLSAIAGVTEIADMLHASFIEHIAIPFSHDWLKRAVASGYLSHSVLSPPSSPTKAKARTQFASVSATKPSQPLAAAGSSFAWHAVSTEPRATGDVFSSVPSTSFLAQPSSAPPFLAPSPSGHNIFQQGSVFQQDAVLSRDIIDFMNDISHGCLEDIDFVKHVYLNVGRDKWLPMIQARFGVKNTTIMFLVSMLKKLDT
ncbi:hypothetical protein PILCRDRAFT_821643 [Piloderma croceum F 1598]|uniref:Uncharacterized protein n=1 Tax=Piloderma croceum (strain F 1598) TaxID=765440 RepID=A0A0C3F986_PILCF|nr:hypothetical protein PILCRDRAFT_821643 [Piloderma croceum F 1598]